MAKDVAEEIIFVTLPFPAHSLSSTLLYYDHYDPVTIPLDNHHNPITIPLDNYILQHHHLATFSPRKKFFLEESYTFDTIEVP